MGKFRNLVNHLIDMWVKDVTGLCDLTASYDVLGWELKRDKLLDAGNDELKQRLISNAHLERLPKAATLLTTCRRMLKGLNADGSWLRVPVDTLSRSQSVAAHAGLTAEFIHFAKQILIELPSIVNNMRRKKAAVVLLDKVKSQQNTVQIGEALEERLKKIADGTWPEKTENTEGDADAGGDVEVEGDDGEDNEPLKKKRRRSEDGVQRLLGKALDVDVHRLVVELQLCCAASTLLC